MDQIKSVIAQNITALRTRAGMTQLELAEHLNYSDKAVSKWERAEALPDVAVLQQIGIVFGVTVNDLLDPKCCERSSKATGLSKSIMALAVTAIWTLASVVFIVGWLMNSIMWQVFIYAIPTSLVTVLVMHSVWEKGKYNFLIVGGLTAASIASLYFIFFRYNWWQLFLLLIPAEAIVWLAFRIKHR